jgi:hypothetical protein
MKDGWMDDKSSGNNFSVGFSLVLPPSPNIVYPIIKHFPNLFLIFLTKFEVHSLGYSRVEREAPFAVHGAGG